MKPYKMIALLLLSSLMFSGCGGGADKPAPSDDGSKTSTAVKNNEPVTIKVFQDLTGITDEEFQMMIADPVKKVYPNITMELVRHPKGVSLNDLVLQGDFPDLIYASSIDIDLYNQANLLVDLDDYVKKSNVDLSQFEQGALETIRAYSPQHKLAAFPIFLEYGLNYYNKDIFDKFGVSYPKDGMSWDETVELAKKVNRLDNGQPYYGLQTFPLPRLSVSLRLPLVDPQTEKASLTTNGWKDALDLFKTVKNMQTGLGEKLPAPNFQKGNLAMTVAYFGLLGQLEEQAKQGEAINWDIAQFPSFEGKSLSESAAVSLMLTSQSKHPELAFEVAKLLTSKENQEIIAKQARKPVIKDADLIKSFGTDLVSLKGKNINVIFKGNVEKNPVPSKYDRYVKDAINKEMPKALNGGADTNTSLRDFQEAADKAIQENK